MFFLAVLLTVATLAGPPGERLCVPVVVDGPIAGLQFVVVHDLDEFGEVLAGENLSDQFFLANGEKAILAGLDEITGEVAKICVDKTTNLTLTEVVASSGLGQPIEVEVRPGRAVLIHSPQRLTIR